MPYPGIIMTSLALVSSSAVSSGSIGNDLLLSLESSLQMSGGSIGDELRVEEGCDFAVWDEGELVPFAKAYSGLTDEEIAEVDKYVRGNTVERFGPVRSVTPKLVFEIAFENIQSSKRHKSGVAVRFPRIARWRRDLDIRDADTLESIRNMAD